MTPTDTIRAAQLEPIVLVQSVSRSWHVLNATLDGNTYARTQCHREVKVREIRACTVADIAHHREPTGGKYCCECKWSAVRFGSAWGVVVAEIVSRASTGILEADQRELATTWGVPVGTVEGALYRLTFHRGEEKLRYRRIDDEPMREDHSHWGSYYAIGD